MNRQGKNVFKLDLLTFKQVFRSKKVKKNSYYLVTKLNVTAGRTVVFIRYTKSNLRERLKQQYNLSDARN